MLTRQPHPHCRANILLLALVGTVVGVAPHGLLAAEPDALAKGKQIYTQQCASCHGDQGEGVTDAYSNPLTGDRSIGELASYIDKTMPEGEPEKCVGDDAKAVAAYIHEAFYSPTAQARNKPARIQLSRLTVRQYRHSVADLVESFRWSNFVNTERGLKGEYFKNRRSNKENRVLERVDPTIRFDYGQSAPVPDKLDAKEYFTRWTGGLIVPVTGEYEFVLKTDNAGGLWLNDMWGTAIIDANVKSGNDTEYRGSAFLIGGRPYGVRVEHYKNNEATGNVEVLWKPPHQQMETIPERYLCPQPFAEMYVVPTSFPPDDRSVGYERGTAISKAWEEGTTEGALDTAAYVLEHVDELAKTKANAGDRVAKLKEFCAQFAERAFRHPLSPEERTMVVDQQFEDGVHPDLAVQRSILLTLKSPRFLYREIDGDNDPYNVASRLSYALWDSIPDNQLRDAAKRDQLKTPEQIRQQAQRMVREQRATGKLREFLYQWLKVEQMHDLSKDPAQFPEFSEVLVSDLRTSLDLMLDEVLRSEQADLRQLLLADTLYMNHRLAKFYGADVSESDGFRKVSLNSGERAGVLSHPFLMSGFAYYGASSPIHRGVFIARSILGRSLRAPPVAVAPLAPDLHADLTTRERTALQTSPDLCNSCHSLINPLGFGLEHFDAVGRYRDKEKNKSIDASGVYITRSGREVPFKGVRQLAEFLANDVETHTAFTEQLFHFLVKQPILAYGPEARDQLVTRFAQSNFNIRQLAAEIATTAAIVPPPPEAVTTNR